MDLKFFVDGKNLNSWPRFFWIVREKIFCSYFFIFFSKKLPKSSPRLLLHARAALKLKFMKISNFFRQNLMLSIPNGFKIFSGWKKSKFDTPFFFDCSRKNFSLVFLHFFFKKIGKIVTEATTARQSCLEAEIHENFKIFKTKFDVIGTQWI